MHYLINGRGPYRLPRTFVYRVFYYPLNMWLTGGKPVVTWVLVRVQPDGRRQYASLTDESLRAKMQELPSDAVEYTSANELQKRLNEDLGYPYNSLDKVAQSVGDLFSGVIPLLQRIGAVKVQDSKATPLTQVEFVVGETIIHEESQQTWTMPVGLLAESKSEG